MANVSQLLWQFQSITLSSLESCTKKDHEIISVLFQFLVYVLLKQVQIMRLLLIPMGKHLLMLSWFCVRMHQGGDGMDVFYLLPQIYFPLFILLCPWLQGGLSPLSFQMDWANEEPSRRLKGGEKETDLFPWIEEFIPLCLWKRDIYSPHSLSVGHHGWLHPLKRKGTAGSSALRSSLPDPSH